MNTDRSWMWRRLDNNGYLSTEFIEGVHKFLDFAYEHPRFISDDTIKCPCSKCRNTKFFDRGRVHHHLYMNGFHPGYNLWYAHGEPIPARRVVDDSPTVTNEGGSRYRTMVMDAMGPEISLSSTPDEQLPNSEAQKFFDLLKDADEPLWDGCQNHTKLSAVAQLLNVKSEYNMPGACYDRIISIIKSMLPNGEKLPENFYKTKKQLSKLGLGYEKIDACENNCVLYYKENKDRQGCPVCGHARYKTMNPGRRKQVPFKVLRYLPLIPRLQRLYASSYTCEQMSWQAKNRSADDMAHPSHGEAWKHFDRTHPSFASDLRNIRLGLCTDGFSPFGNSSIPYSCWPVIITVYNLPPWMCMQTPFMFLNMVIPGPKSPGKNIDVFLRPLIDELKTLWTSGVETYDVCNKQNFNMRAALMWTISDFPGYAMLSGWSTHGRLACPYCMEKTKSFFLKYGKKASWFDCHRPFLPHNHPYRRQAYNFFKGRIENDHPPVRLSGEDMCRRVEQLPDITFGKPPGGKQQIDGFGKTHNWVKKSIFWELPYWRTNLIRHNLDVMHIEKNVFDNVFNTVMDVKGKTKDNAKARKDLELYCSRRELHLLESTNGKILKPKGAYTLNKSQIKEVCSWAKMLKLPDGYSSNIARCVKEEECKFQGMKSHDCHVFMQRLLPIAFRDLLPKLIWEALTELSSFFKDICATVLRVEHMQQLHKNIVEILCKLEKIFPPGFFDSMEHLPVHLPYEAMVGGPVQYRWMYPFERYLYHLKKKIGNRARVEASIVEAYMIEEVSTFCSSYFEPNIPSRLNRIPRNDDGGAVDPSESISICTHPGRPLGNSIGDRSLNADEMKAAHRYVLMNHEKIDPYLKRFEEEKRHKFPRITVTELNISCDTDFADWLRVHVRDTNNEVDDIIRKIAHGPKRQVSCYKGYFVNGFKFHTSEHGRSKATTNSGVCILGSTYNEHEVDYYGLLEEILELEYFGFRRGIVLFKCHWYDNSDKGTRVHKPGLVEINLKLKLTTNDSFVLASQARQVCYTPYPSVKRERRDWWAVCKVKSIGKFDIPVAVGQDSSTLPSFDTAFQEKDTSAPPSIHVENDEINIVSDDMTEEIELDEVEGLQQAMTNNQVNRDDAEHEEEHEFEYTESEEEDEHDEDEDDSEASDNDIDDDD